MKEIPIRQIKPAATEPKISQTFRIRDVKTLLGGKDMAQELHRHNFFFLLALAKGKGDHVIDFIPYKVSDQCIFIMRPGQVHELSLHSSCTGFLLEFNMEFYHLNDRGTSQMLRRATKTNLCEVNKPSFEKLHSILAYILQEYKDQKDGFKEVIRAQLDIFFIEFVRNRQQAKQSNDSASAYEQERLEEFLQLIETHISSKKQISEYADMLNVSPYQLAAITKGILGKTPSDLINEYIILESKRYLLATSDQVNQIAWHLGYEDPSYFIRFFKKHTGHSPDAFRQISK
ncbi:MAG TPA: AraC family transcriptional regulator [Cyclobacteriaceae bacterium]|nr:AraC family transcriptional regulator [Cyclobacteriaceae bacterium]